MCMHGASEHPIKRKTDQQRLKNKRAWFLAPASGTQQLGTIMLSEYKLVKWERERGAEQFMCWEERQM